MRVGKDIFWVVGGGFTSFMGGWGVGRQLSWVDEGRWKYILGGWGWVGIFYCLVGGVWW